MTISAASNDELVGRTKMYDNVDFLQGELKNTAQHIQITCSDNNDTKSKLTEELLSQALSLSSLPSLPREDTTVTTPSNATNMEQIQHESNNLHRLSLLNSQHSKNNCRYSMDANNTPLLSETSPKSNRKIKTSRTKAASGETTARPLPKPPDGSETTNASYTTNALQTTSGSNLLIVSSRSCSRSCNNLTATDIADQNDINNNLLLTSSHSRSWNDLLRADINTSSKSDDFVQCSSDSIQLMRKHDRSRSEQLPNNLKHQGVLNNSRVSETRARHERAYSEQLTSSSTSSKLRNFFSKGRNGSEPDLHSSFITEHSSSLEVSPMLQDGFSQLTISACEVDIYTVDVRSNLYNLIRESWMQSLLQDTYNLNGNGTSEKFTSKVNRSAAVEKFTEVKEEILKCEKNDQFFLLTKEIIYACKTYLKLKKKTWQSGVVIQHYLKKVKLLMESDARGNDRMDEIDTLIIIGEFFVCLFQGSEMFSQRNVMINENSATFVRLLIQYVVMCPKLTPSSASKHKRQADAELVELLDTWFDTCVAVLYEIIYAANISCWNCKLEKRSFDVAKVAQCFSTNENNMMRIIRHVAKRLIAHFTGRSSCILPVEVIQLYKELTLLEFIALHCPRLMTSMKVAHQEEVKYYIASSAIDQIPKSYPLSAAIMVLLPDVVQMITS